MKTKRTFPILCRIQHLSKCLLLAAFCLLLFSGQFVKAHESNNTIVVDKNSWATLCYGFGSSGPCCVSTEYIYFEGDSVFNGLSYKKVFSCDDELHVSITFEGLIREYEQKTYIIKPNTEKEYLLYNFSIEEGMSFEYENYLTGDKVVTGKWVKM